MTLNHDSAREEVNRQEAAERMAAALHEHVKDCIYAKFDGSYCMGCNFYKDHAALEHYRHLLDQEKARREVDGKVDPHT
jgi:hypothetical protein